MSKNTTWSVGANCVQNNVAVGGRLALSKDALVFMPHGFEKTIDSLADATGLPLRSMLGAGTPAEALEISLAEIKSVGTMERDFSLQGLFSGGLRERLSVTRRDGQETIFVVNDLANVIERITAALP